MTNTDNVVCLKSYAQERFDVVFHHVMETECESYELLSLEELEQIKNKCIVNDYNLVDNILKLLSWVEFHNHMGDIAPVNDV